MNLLPARFRSQQVEPVRDQVQYSLDEWISYVNELYYNGNAYFTQGANQTQPGQRQEYIGPAYSALTSLAYKSDSVVFACMQTRAQHFAQVRFQWRRVRDGQPQDLFGTADLQPLETPWPGGTTQDLLTKMIQHADLGGNAFVVRKGPGLALLRPDWVTIIIGSDTDPELGAWATSATILGYVYTPGGQGTSGYETEVYMADEVAHFAPTPDPLAIYRGMSWLTPLMREVMADKAATEHKLRFFENPTPNMIVKFDVADLDEYKSQVAAFKDAHMGAQNAYKWMFATSGVDASVVGSNMQDLDYRLITGAGETRIAAAARTPPVLVGLSEGLQGSSLNAGNYQAARRHFVDETIRYLWANACGSLSNIMAVPGGAELWYDDRYTAFVKEDIGERADVELKKAQTIRFLVDAGYLPESVINAVEAEDLGLLEHSGLFSVQLQPANAPKQGIFTGVPTPIQQTGVEPAGQVSAPQPATNGNGNNNGRHALDELLEALEGLRERPMEIHNHLPDQDPTRGQYEPPPVNVTVEAGEPPRLEIAEGAFRTEIAPPPPAEVNVTVEGAQPPDVNVSMDLEPVADGLRALAEAQSERNIEVTVPERAVTVNVPDPSVPVVNVTNEVQTPEVTVNVPDQPAPVVNVTVEDEPLDATVKFKRRPDGTLDSAKISDNTETDG